eukprot:TRINITY_DN6423_c0_g2_i1.p1 TRINITY_DN6423_c0_g2~~TRINITY_DN6423_c0_g2_i1.p1  ORF type:complete len:127 (-),score=8.20 TRINITY_DN6423_c0_g2_i1:29-409(-)
MTMKHELEKIEVQLSKYLVKKVHPNNNYSHSSDAIISVCQAPMTSELSLEIFTGGQWVKHSFDDVKSILKHMDSQTRFTITYQGDTSDTFDSEIRNDILDNLHEFYKTHRRVQQERKEFQLRTKTS